MTKEKYFDMCAELGSEPILDEIPVTFDDFILEVQEAFELYNLLKDEWDVFNGLYLGKNLVGITEIFNISGTEPEYRYVMVLLIKMIDRIRTQEINSKKEKPAG